MSAESENDSGNSSLDIVKEEVHKKKGTVTRKKWSKDELAAVEHGFRRNLLNKRIPKVEEVERIVKKFPALVNRSTAQIKSKVQHLINSQERVASKLLKKTHESVDE